MMRRKRSERRISYPSVVLEESEIESLTSQESSLILNRNLNLFKSFPSANNSGCGNTYNTCKNTSELDIKYLSACGDIDYQENS